MRLHAIAKCAKRRRRKNEEIILEFWLLVSQDWLAQFALNFICRFTYQKHYREMSA